MARGRDRRTARFDGFEVDIRSREIRRDGQPLAVHSQSLEILVILLEAAGRLVSREAIRASLWPDDTVVDFDHSINAAVRKLRQALGDDSNDPRYIETLSKRGYRFRATVEWVTRGAEAAAAAAGGRDQSHSREAARRPRSIAVLPFADLSGTKENEYFSDGLTEDIINNLARVPGFKVTARTSAFAFRGQGQDVRKIASALDVSFLLEGSLRRAGNRIRVMAQLIDGANGFQVWSEQYDGELGDIFTVQDELAKGIARELRLQLGDRAELRGHQPSLAAYEAYLKGRYHLTKGTPQGIARAKEFFEQAIALDPVYLAPYCELGTYYVFLAVGGALSLRDAAPLVREQASKALALDPAAPLAHAQLGFIASTLDYDWDVAEEHFQIALAANPVPPDARVWYAYCVLARLEDGWKDIEYQMGKAVEQDPLNALLRVVFGGICFHEGLIDEALEHARKALELDEHIWLGHFGFGSVNLVRGRFAEAIPHFRRAFQLAPWSAEVAAHLAGTLTCAGQHSEAEELVRHLSTYPPHYAPLGLAIYHCICQQPEAAAEWMEKAIEQRFPFVLMYYRNPLTKALQKSSRWPALGRLMNLPGTE